MNKKPLPAASIGKDDASSNGNTKAGSRGVVIYPGDIIQLGASTRIYCVEGPAEYERGRPRPVPPVPESSSTIGSSSNQPSTNIKTETAPPPPTSIKTQKAEERIRALQFKLANVQQESQRIRAKAYTTELTSGQERQLERNDAREQQLQEQLEAALRQKEDQKEPQQGASTMASRNKKVDYYGEDDEVDDFYDQTKSPTEQHSMGDDDVQHTEKSLLQKWNELCRDRHVWEEDAALADAKRRIMQQRANDANSDFFAQNDLDIAADECQRAQRRIEETDAQMDEVEKLLRIVNPKLKELSREPAKQPEDGTQKSPKPQLKQAKPENRSLSSQEPRAVLPPIMPSQPTATETLPSILPTVTPTTTSLGTIPPPPSQSHGTLPLPHKRAAEGFAMAPPVPKRRLGPNAQPSLSATKTNAVDTWQAPTDQDGSGRTRLNDKFAGRY